LQENQEISKTAALAKEYFIPTHWNATVMFATINDIYPYKIETEAISNNIEKGIYSPITIHKFFNNLVLIQ